MSELTNKVALITGASRGIGRALAVGMAKSGADIVIADLPSQQVELEQTQKQILETGRKCVAYSLDVTNKKQVEDVIGEALQEFGEIDILVNNAGILKPSKLEDLDEADWDAHFDVNGKGVLLMTNAILSHMKQRNFGRIINIASIAGRQGVATQGHYAATKSTVITLTRVYAQEVGEFGITVNAICPGIILTEMGKNNLGSDEAIKHWQEVAALKRLGAPEDVVGPAVFFASELSNFVTGQALNVCGGIYFH
ncbi:short-chain dehydrogenase/reductase SDR [Vibrio nigripulchritudo ATCC 27043]|uniref:SDR family NAD(P)-dependent oxidoreductase n=1 Tax=Vibrio nigripulchritudo TaxID=28173 RepID=UPI00021C10FE|nr:SDR family NAD(P)-dependent oxidoreductase [Vibrio nigripulchritudo]EGU60589.1 short-chain dehydrogenase/reductase SDR [Vibrio nigripulchritudo ATCC 27043]